MIPTAESSLRCRFAKPAFFYKKKPTRFFTNQAGWPFLKPNLFVFRFARFSATHVRLRGV